MRRRRKKARPVQPVREMSDTAKWTVVGMGAAILAGVFYLLTRNDPSVPGPTGSQVPAKAPPPPEPVPLLTVQSTYSAIASNGSTFTLRVGDTVAFRPPTPGGQWGRAVITSSGGSIHPAGITDLGLQFDNSYMIRADSPGIATVNLGYTETSGTNNIAIGLTVLP
jgi:hypothetical protein